VISVVAVSLLLATSTIAAASDPGYADSPDNEVTAVAVVADFLVVRPLGIVATVVGTTMFVLALPFGAMAGDISTPAHLLVVEPAAFTFKRPLGDLQL
jgi:hypothetical protein